MKQSARTIARWSVSLVLLAPCGLYFLGCQSPTPSPASIQSADPDERIRAIRTAADARDASAVPLIVDRLEDEDSAVRFFAILALDRITGQRFGYDYGAPAVQRAAAVQRWREYVQDPRRAAGNDARGLREARNASAHADSGF